MLIDFSKMEETVLQNFYGGKQEMIANMHIDAHNRILRGRLAPGASIGMHAHETSSEIIYILQGSGKALCDDSAEPLAPGLCHYCPKGHSHSIVNDGAEELVFFAVVPQQ